MRLRGDVKLFRHISPSSNCVFLFTPEQGLALFHKKVSAEHLEAKAANANQSSRCFWGLWQTVRTLFRTKTGRRRTCGLSVKGVFCGNFHDFVNGL